MFFFVVLYIVYVFFMVKTKKSKFKFSELVLPVLLFMMVLTVDFSVNYSSALNPEIYDGISIHGILMFNFFNDETWTVYKFYSGYRISATISVFLVIGFMVSLVIDRVRGA